MNPQGIKTHTLGSALIEFALLLPVLVVIVLGTIELGWALYIQNTLVDAAREGARIAVTQNVSSIDIVNEVDTIIQNANLTSNNASITITPTAISLEPRGTAITVAVSLPYNAESILPSPLFLNGVTLQAQVTMTKEY